MKPRISVLQFTNADVRGGAEEHILMLLRGLDRGCFRLHLVCPPALAGRLQPDAPSDIEIIPLDVSRPTQFDAMLRLARILRQRRVDILHSHMFCSSMLASPIGWLSRVPVIVETAHGREAWRRNWFKSRCYVDRAVSLFVDRYIAVSEANARYLMERKRVPARKITVIYPACDVSRFSPAHPRLPDRKRSLGFQDDDPLLVFVGRLEPQKGHRVLLEAMPAVRKEFPTARLVCAGEGKLRQELESQAHTLGLDEAVRFIGYPADVRDWLALADLTVLPSFYEGLPATAIESLAAGRAMVATAVDGTPEVIIDGKTGLTVPPGDPQGLAGAICRLLRDPELRTTLARTGRQWVLEQFSQECLIRRTQQFYLDAWQQHLRTIKADGAKESLQCAR